MPLVKQVRREPSVLRHNKLKIKIICTFTGYILKWLRFGDLPALLFLEISKMFEIRKTLIRRIKP